jgi:quercetin dioxygenase-like cupin family protein
MKRTRIHGAGLVFILAAVIFLSSCGGQEEPVEIETAEPFSCVRIYSDPDGQSHFADDEFSFELVDYAPPAPPISVSEAWRAEGVHLISSPPGWYGDWHPAPRRQFVVMLVGKMEVEVSDGEARRFSPGDILLVEDTTGQGHISRAVGKERVYLAVVPLE